MKFEDVKKIVERANTQEPAKEPGFRVHFDVREGGMVRSDYFPDQTEAPIKSLEIAQHWQVRFFNSSDKDMVKNIQIRDQDHRAHGEKLRPY